MISFGIFKHFVYHYFLIVSVNGSYNHSRPFEKVDFDICPFTNFCHQNATAALNMKGKVPCCTPCSCSDNCWGLGNCCPDKELIGHSVTELKCALAMVKEPGIKNTMDTIMGFHATKLSPVVQMKKITKHWLTNALARIRHQYLTTRG